MTSRITRAELAARIAADIPDGSYVNLGIGSPTLVANFLTPDKEVVLHTENGLLGMGPAPDEHHADPDVINAGKTAVTAVPGASYFDQAESFAMIRGGHIDICVLGAFQVSQTGDLANWSTGSPNAIPAVGGAMDLATGAKKVYVMTDVYARDGSPKLVESCSYPLTAVGCVSRVYTDVAIFDISESGFVVREAFGNNTVRSLSEMMGLSLRGSGAS